MKKNLLKSLRFYCYAIMVFCSMASHAQTTVFSENMGAATGTTTIVANTFQNSGTLTYSGTGDVRVTTPSTTSAYSSASGGANLFITNAANTYFTISGINTLNYTGLSLSFGHYKSSGTTVGYTDLAVEYSTDGTNYTNIAYTRTTTGATWALITATGTIPASSALSLRFRQTGTVTQYRIDDVKLTGTLLVPTVTTALASALTTSGAASGGNVTATGASPVTARGVVWGTSSVPTVALTTKTTDGSGTGTFTSAVTGLAVNTKYYYRAYATNTQGTGYGTENYFYTHAATPAAPTVAGATISSLNVSISDSNNNTATQYAIRVNGTNFVQADGSLGTAAIWKTAGAWATKTVTGLTAGTAYTFDIKAESNADTPVETAYSATATGTTLAATTPHLTLGTSSLAFGPVCINATGSGSFTFSGENLINPATVVVSALSGYSYSLTSGGTYTPTLTIANYTGASTTVYVQFSPVAVQSYGGAIAVNGQGGNNAAQFTVSASGTGINTAATVTTVAMASSISQTGGTLSGTDIVGCTAITAYAFEYSTVSIAPGSGTTVAATTTGTTFSVSLTGLIPATTYYYRAKITDGTGTIYGNQYSFITSALAAPVAAAATDISQTGFTANWDAVANANQYLLDVSTSPTFGGYNSSIVATDLFISEYGEGTSNNKYIEIYNGTGATVDLSNYRLRLYVNGSTSTSNDVVLSGSLANGAVAVYRNTGATLYTGATVVNSAVAFNGNDAVALYKISTTSNVDIIGRIGEDPGTAWTAAGGYSTVDRTLRRKNTVTGGVTTNPAAGFPTLATEWDVYEQDNFTNLGTHDFGYVASYLSGYQATPVSGLSQVITGLTGYTNYYYRVRANSTTSTSVYSNTIAATTKTGQVTWIVQAGHTEPEWVPSTYPDNSPVVIDNTVSATIAADYTTAINGTLNVKSLTLNSGKHFTVSTGNTLTVTEGLTNNADAANFVVQNNAAVLQGDTASNTTPITVHKNSNALYRLDYTLWASPVSGQTLSGFAPATSADRFYTYVATPANANATTGHYQAVSNTTVFADGAGYLIRTPNTGSAAYVAGTETLTVDGTFTGTPHNGDIAVALNATGDQYTAVGNPYPSPIGVAEVFAAGNGVLDGASPLYFWRKRNNAGNLSYYSVTATSYVLNSQDSGTAITGFDGDPSTWTIAPGQGFFIKAGAGSSFTFTNSMRKPATATQTFFRSAHSLSRFWINISDVGNNFSQASVAYADGATLGLDYSLDGAAFSITGTSIYTTAENKPLAVQTRPAFQVQDVVPVGFTVPANGQYTITLDHFDGVFADGQNVYIKDKLLGLSHNLNESPYSFTAEAGNLETRFEVAYTTDSTDGSLGTQSPVLDAKQVMVYKQDKAININAGTATINSVTVFDIRGRKLFSQDNVNDTTVVINSLNASQEVLIVEVATAKGTVSKKIVY